MRLDRLIPSLPLPLQPSGRREERPPRRQPDTPARPAPDAATDQPGDAADERRQPPDHLDIIV